MQDAHEALVAYVALEIEPNKTLAVPAYEADMAVEAKLELIEALDQEAENAVIFPKILLAVTKDAVKVFVIVPTTLDAVIKLAVKAFVT